MPSARSRSVSSSRAVRGCFSGICWRCFSRLCRDRNTVLATAGLAGEPPACNTRRQEHRFVVLSENKNGQVLIEQRNRFKVGETLEVLSPNKTFNKTIAVESLKDENGADVMDALQVQQKLHLKTNLKLMPGDILRKKIV